jgi:hypothetical protein
VQLPLQRSTPHESPLLQPRVSPGAHAPPPEQAPKLDHGPHVQLAALHVRVRECRPVPQLPQLCVSVSVAPGMHSTDSPPHAPQLVTEPQRQSMPHVRMRVCVPEPQRPHGWVSGSTVPAAHSPSSEHIHAPHVQSGWHSRACTPQLPQAAPISMLPGAHEPAMQVPSSTHRPPTQICRCCPHIAHETMRGGAPASQSQLVGASHAAHTPSVQRSTPLPQSPEQVRSAVLPTAASKSSQSTPTSMPSPSVSTPGG